MQVLTWGHWVQGLTVLVEGLLFLTGGASCPQPLPSYLTSQLQQMGSDPPLWIYAPPMPPFPAEVSDCQWTQSGLNGSSWVRRGFVGSLGLGELGELGVRVDAGCGVLLRCGIGFGVRGEPGKAEFGGMLWIWSSNWADVGILGKSLRVGAGQSCGCKWDGFRVGF